eukprot:CAMPEP_0179454118 /NCGR_PEP_ID=MMETSP0799-20121207/37977_1 /TAXON_ID=46947 /ORGANISM="Geminigera cryophila, Strain CCMP2564" /LENGTH=44 /DNA_ID= /DNA_START= /DNA_END= /DNA_ORIENTATION=
MSPQVLSSQRLVHPRFIVEEIRVDIHFGRDTGMCHDLDLYAPVI